MQSSVHYRVIIPAAGKSSRSGLPYPKTLYRLGGTPIIVRILQLLKPYDDAPILIINPAFKDQFETALREAGLHATLLFQEMARGMGDALLQADAKLASDEHIIVLWSDIPLIGPHTVKSLVQCHEAHENSFSLATWIGKDCYTIVERKEGKLQRVLETRALGMARAPDGERDTGLFVFRKEPLFGMLRETAAVPEGKEHGFLYAIEHLVAGGEKVEGYPLATDDDVLSFNTAEELAAIEARMGL